MQTRTLQPLEKSATITVEIPGSKSVTNRALILGALTSNPVKITHPLWSEDTEAMVKSLHTFGIKTIREKNSIQIVGNIDQVQNSTFDIYAHQSGTTIRFILALSCIVPGMKKIYGDLGLNKRPIGDLVDGLRSMGANIVYLEKNGYPPLLVKSDTLSKSLVQMNGNISSQFISALLMIGPEIGGLQIDLKTSQISRSYIDLTMQMMQEWGVRVNNIDDSSYRIDSGVQYQMEKYAIEGDYSAAGYFAAIAVLTRSKIILKNLQKNSMQGDRYFLQILEQMGNEVVYGGNEVTITGRNLRPVNVNMEKCPDQVQTLAVLVSFAKGKSVLTGVRSLRVKETERVQALQAELGKMGIQTESPDADTLIVYGGDPKPATIETYGDHRMAMSFAVAGSKLKGMKINDPQVVKKTFPDFWDKLQEIGVTNI